MNQLGTFRGSGNEHILQIYIQEDEKEVEKVRGQRKRDERARHSDLSRARAYIHAERHGL